MSDLRTLGRYVKYRWKLFRRWLDSKMYVTPLPEDDEWVEQLQEWNESPEKLGGAFYIDGVLYKRTWAGVLKA